MELYLIFSIALFLMILERIIPDQRLPIVDHWWARVIFLNSIQLGIVLIAGISWDLWLQRISLLNLGDQLPPMAGGFSAYLVITFVFYWWHRIRHDSNFCWLLFHQLHHSPQRIETITSFFKHPLEIVFNSVLIGSISFTFLGLTLEGGAWVTLFTALAELFYHMNIKTPRWVGYILQRPEMHRVHHQRGRHYMNFADLPVWDMLFGTYENPVRFDGKCGFKPEREARFWEIFSFNNVNNLLKRERGL